MNREPIKIIADIIKNQLSLTDDQVRLYNQQYTMPETSGLFIVLSQINSTSFANNNKYVENETQDGINEEQSLNTQKEIAIDMFSKNREAQTREEEVRLALNSYFANQQEELYQFRITNINSPLQDLSAVEGEGILNRFRLTVRVFAWSSKTSATDFYDNNFDPEVETEPNPE